MAIHLRATHSCYGKILDIGWLPISTHPASNRLEHTSTERYSSKRKQQQHYSTKTEGSINATATNRLDKFRDRVSNTVSNVVGGIGHINLIPSNTDIKNKIKESVTNVGHLSELQLKKLSKQFEIKRKQIPIRPEVESVNREQHTFQKHVTKTNECINSFYDTAEVDRKKQAKEDAKDSQQNNAIRWASNNTEQEAVAGSKSQNGSQSDTEMSYLDMLYRLPETFKLSKAPSNVIEQPNKPILRRDFISKSYLDRRTRDLVENVRSAASSTSRLRRLEELCVHLTKYPDCRTMAMKRKVLPCLLQLIKSTDGIVRAHAHEALSLIGYVMPPKGRGIRMISIDGGGTRGLVAIETLRMLEIACQKPIHQMFDYVIGTSTGALVAALVFLFRVPLSECEELYIDRSMEMFTQSQWRGRWSTMSSLAYHDTEKFENILRNEMGEKTMVEFARDPSCPKISMASTLVNVPKWKNFMFRNYNLPPGMFSDYPGNCKQKVWEVVRASAAAPLFYKEFELGDYVYRDGGLLANNPTALGIHECRLLWPNENFQCVVSVGNGRFEPNLETVPTKGKVDKIRELTNSIIDSATDTEVVHMTMKDTLSPQVYFRFNPYLSEESQLDEIRPERISQMQRDAKMYLHKNDAKLARAAGRLKAERLPHQKVSDYAHRMVDETELSYKWKN